MGDITGPSRTKSKGSKLLEPLKVGWMPPKMSTRGGMGIFTIRKGGYPRKGALYLRPQLISS